MQRLSVERNPRLVVIVEREDALQLLAMRSLLKSMVVNGADKASRAAAKRLLAKA